MRYILTLNKVKRSDLDDVGFRAVDLAVLREKRLNIPLTFVINNQAFEDFLAENGLKAKIERVLQEEKPSAAYNEIISLFNNAILPRELEDELVEAYESLAIDPGATASSIVSEWDYPLVSIIRSPSYLLSTEDTEGIVQNIRGKAALLEGLKSVWASIYSSKSVDYRRRAGISDSFGVGVLVQKMKKITQSAVSYSCSELDEKTIIVKSFIGLQDYDARERILGKDVHEVDADTLMISKAQINVQEYSLVRNIETDELVKHELREEGLRQKLDDKQVAEVARITKRAKSFIGKDLKLYIGIRNAYTYVLLANRLVAEPKRIIVDKDEVKLSVDDKGHRVMEHKQEIVVGQEEYEEPLEMPRIISKEEAREEVLEEEKEGVLVEEEKAENKKRTRAGGEEVIGEQMEEQEPDEKLKKDLEFLDEIEKEEGVKERVEQEGEQGIEQEVEKEVNLLEEVLKIKEVVERMEEHALNKNNEAYEREARKLRDMISRVRKE